MATKNAIRILAASAAVAGGAVAGALLVQPAISGAQESPSTTAPDQGTKPPSSTAPDQGTKPPREPNVDPKQGGHVGENGTKEELLTGETADKVTAAALAANPGATIERVETDAEGDAYEAHIVTADGQHLTVKFDANFNITTTETGHGPGGGRGGKHGPRGGQAPSGQGPAAEDPGTPPTTTR